MTVQEIAVKYSLSKLNKLYLKVSKDVQVYENPMGNGKVWQGWTIKGGTIAGRLNMWIGQHMYDPNNAPNPPIQGIWFEFFINDKVDFVNGKRYYVRFEPNMIDWKFTETQLTAETRANMTFYEGFYNDLEKDLTEWKNNIVDSAKSGLKTGLIAAGAILFTGFVIIPYFKFQLFRKAVKTVAKDIKNS